MEETRSPKSNVEGGQPGCDGQRLKRLAAAALAWLEHNYQKVDALNVFPVPDGDTGTNMLLTMRSAYNEIAENASENVGEIARGIAHGALMGARGNSGVILSQLWRGFARLIDEATHFDCRLCAEALREACDTAYKGVIRPVEGTILTVSREIAEEAEAAVEAGESDLSALLERLVKRAYEAVERTPEQLPVLKKAGVVDAGGMGLTYLLEGMLLHTQGQTFEPSTEVVARAESAGVVVPETGLHYPYDVQFILKGADLDVNTIRDAIDAMGDSTLVVGDASAIKVHVHVLDPGLPLSYGASMGRITDVVVENMREQYEEFSRTQQAVLTTASVEIGPGDIGVVAVVSGDGLTQVFRSLGVAHVVKGGQTMNPSTEELLGAIHSLPTRRVIILPNNKNVLLAARQAAEMARGQDIDVRVVPTVTVPQGINALMALNPQGDLDAVFDAMDAAKYDVSTAEVTTATRSVEIDGVVAKEGQIIGLVDGDLVQAGDDLNTVVMQLLKQMQVGERELITLYYGNGVAAEQAEALADHVRAQFTEQEVEVVHGGQPHYHYILSAE
ncbi:MAG: DAK2 domain-containing protein [Anaerolineae bacterium]